MRAEQIDSMRDEMISDIFSAIEKQRVDVGCGLTIADIIGTLEIIKMRFYLEASGDDILDYTSYSLDEADE